MNRRNPARIVDLTLRDGEQAAGVCFPRSRRLELARALFDAGISELEGGIPAMGGDCEDDFRRLSSELSGATVIAWNRVLIRDIEASLRAEARVVHVAVPSSDVMLGAKLGWSRDRVLEELAAVLEYCRAHGLKTIVGAEDASRADPGFLDRLFTAAVAGGAFRLRYADTLGTEEPFGVRDRISLLASRFPVSLEYHAHNDLGLATANALAALSAGAMVSVTVGGLGERAGNASLEQVTCASALIFGDDLGIRMERLVPLAELVSTLSGRPIPVDRPVIGAGVFTHESGIHVDGLLKSPDTYVFIRPEPLGRRHALIPGAHSGRAALKHCARSLGFELRSQELERLRTLVQKAWAEGAPSDPWTEFSAILKREFSG